LNRLAALGDCGAMSTERDEQVDVTLRCGGKDALVGTIANC
jgi:hypothetical protein